MKTLFTSRRSAVRFMLVLSFFVCAVFLVYREEVLGPPLAPFTTFTAKITTSLIHTVGIEAVREGTILSHPSGFAYDIYYRCIGALPAAFLIVSIFGYPSRLRFKVIGLALGIPFLLGLNQIRLVHLFYIGVYNVSIFDFVHEVLWEGAIILAVIGTWLVWTFWVDAKSIADTKEPIPLQEKVAVSRAEATP